MSKLDPKLMAECEAFLTERVGERGMPHDYDDVTWVMHDFVKKRDGLSLNSASHPPEHPLYRELAFEAALMALAGAKNGNGLLINLMPPHNTAEALKEATFRLLSQADPAAHYITLTPLGVESSDAQEAAYWRNLALLANATAAAIEYEAKTPEDVS